MRNQWRGAALTILGILAFAAAGFIGYASTPLNGALSSPVLYIILNIGVLLALSQSALVARLRKRRRATDELRQARARDIQDRLKELEDSHPELVIVLGLLQDLIQGQQDEAQQRSLWQGFLQKTCCSSSSVLHCPLLAA